ncbi:hypothetical protein GMES_4459 [Paraglaciecola mesophila KMM 241]|uniref:Uncharacterized protein n=1 Tax=Paraglaciecola mesophila KMM 241 TaxID=1128912 RepID=K6ZTS6_9ALTE|nr:hypothetical protein GMES_4459 [Paraglaciecola mesophila KMM 241]
MIIDTKSTDASSIDNRNIEEPSAIFFEYLLAIFYLFGGSKMS